MGITKWHRLFRKIELFFKQFITVKWNARKYDRCINFWCDSHPHICVPCIRLRWFLKTGQFTKALWIKTRAQRKKPARLWLWCVAPLTHQVRRNIWNAFWPAFHKDKFMKKFYEVALKKLLGVRYPLPQALHIPTSK